MKYLVFAAAAFFFAQSLSVEPQCPSMTESNGTHCVGVPGRASCVIPTAAKLTTSPIAEFMLAESSLTSNIFVFNIRSSAVEGRVINSINIESPSGVPSTDCQYPSSNYTRSFTTEPCFDTFKGLFTFQELVRCGIEVASSNTTHTEYSGYIALSGEDYVGKLRTLDVKRTTTSRLKLSVLLPKTTSITLSPLTIISPISLEAAVTEQSYNPITDQAVIVITTSVQYPYILTSIFENSSPINIVSYQFQDTTPCSGNAACSQKIELTISNIQSQSCSFSGTYSSFLTYDCIVGFADCPVPGDSSVSLEFNIESGYVCPSLSIDSQISGKIEASAESSFTSTTSVFSANDTGYFRVSVTTGVTVQTISISSLVINSKTIDITRESSGYNLVQSNNDELIFSSLLSAGTVGSGSLFESDNLDEIFSFSVFVTLDIAYTTTFKRDAQTETHKFSQQFFLDTTVADSLISGDQSSSLVIIPAAAVIAGGIAIANF